MKRGGPLKRRTPLRSRKRRERAGDDPAYLAHVRSLACIVWGTPGATECSGKTEASHVTSKLGVRGTGLKMPDRSAVPHCSGHHREWEERRGMFRGWSKLRRLEQAATWVISVQQGFITPQSLYALKLDVPSVRTAADVLRDIENVLSRHFLNTKTDGPGRLHDDIARLIDAYRIGSAA